MIGHLAPLALDALRVFFVLCVAGGLWTLGREIRALKRRVVQLEANLTECTDTMHALTRQIDEALPPAGHPAASAFLLHRPRKH